MRRSKKALILTCEHGGAQVPRAYRQLFHKNLGALKTHRGLDIGALPIAKDLSRALKSPLHLSVVTRLLVDLNRRLDSPTLFSEFTRSLEETEKQKILNKYYHPHWTKVVSQILKLSQRQKVFHIAVHSMTDQLDDQHRHMQLALLYNPRRKSEKKFASVWIKELRKEFPDFRINRNNPYQGAKGGLTGYFRELLTENEYLGMEIEMNQGYLQSLKTAQQKKNFSASLSRSLKAALDQS